MNTISVTPDYTNRPLVAEPVEGSLAAVAKKVESLLPASGTIATSADIVPSLAPEPNSTSNATTSDVIGNKTDDPYGALGTTKSLMAYAKAAVDELTSPPVDSTGTGYVQQTIGHKGDAASTTVGTTKSLVSYAKGIITKLDGVSTITAADIPKSPIMFSGVCNTNMTASTTVIVCSTFSGFGDDYFNGKFWMAVAKNANSAGNAPEMEYRQITDYVSASGAFTVTAFSANVEANDAILILHESLPFLKYVELTTGSGNWTVPKGCWYADLFIVGGGGGGGYQGSNSGGGGGGGGEVLMFLNYPISGKSSIAYVVGGAGSNGGLNSNGGNGGSSIFDGWTALGGAGGFYGNAASTPGKGGAGGGTCGGAGGAQAALGNAGSSGTYEGSVIIHFGGGGGGGGSTDSYQNSGVGGAGMRGLGGSYASGYAGGAGGGSWGTGGNGAGSTDGSAGTLGGGGGGGSGYKPSRAGGAGYILIRWR